MIDWPVGIAVIEIGHDTVRRVVWRTNIGKLYAKKWGDIYHLLPGGRFSCSPFSTARWHPHSGKKLAMLYAIGENQE